MTPAEPFADRLCAAVRRVGTPAMVGIDPQWPLLPEAVVDEAVGHDGLTLQAVARAYLSFSRQVVDLVSDRVAVVKFQAAFFEALGPAGATALHGSIAAARDAGLLVVLDGKRNDIGSTAAAYAKGYLGEVAVGQRNYRPWHADALTVNAYLGEEGVAPFLQTAKEHGGGLFVLVRTSNPGAGALQDQTLGDGRTVHQVVADWTEAWSARRLGASGYGPVGAVVGATVPEQIADLRRRMASCVLLIPGYGAQGGTAAGVAAAFDGNGLGAVVNSSRGILYAHQQPAHAGRSWQDATRAALDDMIADLRENTPAGNLD